MTMIHAIDDCDPVEMECDGCCGEGRRGDAYCIGCGGTGLDFFSRGALYTLAHNLATAGGLCWSFWGGWFARSVHGGGPATGLEAWTPGCGRPFTSTDGAP